MDHDNLAPSVYIDGEAATPEQATRLEEANLIERCSMDECPHDYHLREGLTYAELQTFLARPGSAQVRVEWPSGKTFCTGCNKRVAWFEDQKRYMHIDNHSDDCPIK